MIPAGFPVIAPPMTLGDVFGPLAPVAVFCVIAGLVVVLALSTAEALTAARRRHRESSVRPATPAASPVRPAA